MFPFFYDPTFILIIPALILAMYAEFKVQHTFELYSKFNSRINITGSVLAKDILRRKGILDVTIEMVEGKLSDHYDPRSKVLRLSNTIYNGTSLAALGIAAHEVGHAIQHHEKYALLGIRNAIVPAASIGSQAAFPLLFIGIIFGFKPLALIGVVIFAFAVLFQVITLPVEFNASSKAMAILSNGAYITNSEKKPVRNVLNAAALTYVAATIMSIMQLLRMLLISGIFGNRDE